MTFLPRLANAVYQNFFNPEWDENAGFFTYKAQEAVMIVVGMMFKIEGPDGQKITPSDIAQVLKYRDQTSLPMLQEIWSEIFSGS